MAKSKKKKPLPEGFKCKCGKEHRYPVYVYGHWDTELTFTCPKCVRHYTIFRGKAEEQ